MYFLRQHNDQVLSRKERQRIILEQLRRQSNMKRIMVSDAIKSLLEHISTNEKNDLLLQGSMLKNKGVDGEWRKKMEMNPFRMKPNNAKNCTIS